jgi:hypothetical protein
MSGEFDGTWSVRRISGLLPRRPELAYGDDQAIDAAHARAQRLAVD